jgi:hypothetical protein
VARRSVPQSFDPRKMTARHGDYRD